MMRSFKRVSICFSTREEETVVVVIRSERFSSVFVEIFLFRSNNRKVLYFSVCIVLYSATRFLLTYLFLLVGKRAFFCLSHPLFIEGGMQRTIPKNPFLTEK